MFPRYLFFVCLVILTPFQSPADERTAADLLPESTVLYAEIPNPAELISTIFDHPLRETIENLEPYKQATQAQEYRNFLTGRKFVEIQLGMEWREAVETLTARGIYVGLDAETQGVAALIRAKDAESLSLFRDKLLELTKLGQNPDQIKQGEYRGVKAYEAGEAKFAIVDDWLVVTNKSDLGTSILDRLIDGEGACLTDKEHFWEASNLKGRSSTAWAFVDVAALRDAGVAKDVFEGQSPNPGVELILGGILSTLGKTPYGTIEVKLDQQQLKVDVSIPHDPAWVPEEREFFFGPGGSGRAADLPKVPDTLFTLSTYRDVSEMWLRAGDLFDEKTNDGLAEADANLTTFFAGKDFGEDILGSLTPQIGFIATRQDFSDILPSPTIKLPSFALVLQLKEPGTMTRELRRTFQSAVGFFNVVGAMEGRPQLELDIEKLDGGAELITSTYIPEEDDRESTEADIIYNFSPTVGFSGERFVVSSSIDLARKLTAAETVAGDSDTNSELQLHAGVLKDVLTDNREQLIAQNILEEGNTREEAEAAIDLLLAAVGYFRDVSLQLDQTEEAINATFSLRIAEQ